MAAFLSYQNNKKNTIVWDQDFIYKSINKLVDNIKCNYYNKKYQFLQY